MIYQDVYDLHIQQLNNIQKTKRVILNWCSVQMCSLGRSSRPKEHRNLNLNLNLVLLVSENVHQTSRLDFRCI